MQRADVDIDTFHLHATLAMQHLGRFDPSGSRGADWFGKVHLDREGRVLVWRLSRTAHGLGVQVTGHGAAALDTFVAQFPLADGADSFRPQHHVLHRLANGFRGLRLMRVPWPFDVAAGAVLQQRVRWRVAYNHYRLIAERWGTRTSAGVAFPNETQLASVPVHRLEALGLDPKRARALAGLARAAARQAILDPAIEPGEARQRLLRIPGIGPWTANTIAGFALGDADAVPVGDLHLPSLVAAALAGDTNATDQRMLELLEPYRGQRFRVVRLLSWAARHAPHALREPRPR